MRRTIPVVAVIALVLVVAVTAAAGLAACSTAGDAGGAGAADQAAAPHDAGAIEAILADIESGWENADGVPFERHYLDWEGGRYIESGGQNVGLRDLIDNHVVPEGEHLESLELELSDVETHFEDGFAWAVADVEVVAVTREEGRRLHLRGYETFLFRDVAGEWKVVHSHSSTRPVREPTEEVAEQGPEA